MSRLTADWNAKRVNAAVHAQRSPINWALFKPSTSPKRLKVVEWGHGGVGDIRKVLKSRDNEVVYGLMRLSFDFGKTKTTKWLFFVWYELALSLLLSHSVAMIEDEDIFCSFKLTATSCL